MKAIVQSGYGTPEQVLRLGEIDRPSVGDDEVLVRMRASSVNTPDWLTVTGTPYILRLKFGLRGPRTAVRGSDLAGVVEAVGQGVTDLKQGDEVFGSSWADDLGTSGTFADYAVAPAAKIIRKPTGLTFEDASASVMSGLTALIAIRDVANAGPHTRLLINGASGGVGTFAVQIAKTLGAEVTGVCSTRNLELVNSLGADHVIDYTEEDFTQSGKRYNVILDNVINHWPKKLSSALAPGGMLIPNSIGTTGGMFASLFKVARATLMGRGSIEVKFVNLEVTHENLNDLAKLHESGDVKPVIDTVYPLKEAPKAVAHMLGHHAAGNIVIKM
ncbi:MAG: NAD(P)-dependent alcohol dehydrogenase [Caldilineaceae bacterium SB0666_bin_21]|nr:NAD(P)-dependent alcohol dehydrogenase [Caldilineaceae bacterium SB0666_bin_21]